MIIKKNYLLNFIGIFLIVLGVVRVFQLIFFGEPIHIIWLCNHLLIFMGIFILVGSSFWLIALFSFLFVGQFFWIIGFLLYVVFGIALPGSSAYLIYDSQFINILSLLVHFLTLPLAFLAIFIMGKKEKFAWLGGLVFAIVLIPFVLYFGSQYNLNCFYEP